MTAGPRATAASRACAVRVAFGRELADAVPCLATRERLAALADQYAAEVGALARGEAWRRALDSHERIVARANGAKP